MGSQLATQEESQIEVESSLMKTVSVISGGPVLYKLSVVGDHRVGKTIFLKLSAGKGSFDPSFPYAKTVGSALETIELSSLGAILNLWELSGLRGGDKTREMNESQLSQNQAGIFMYSVNDQATWDSLKTYYLPLYRKFHPNNNSSLIVGNLTNKEGTVEVDPTEAQAFALKEGLFWCQFDLSTVQPAELVSKLTELVEKMQAQG